ncbi:MAG: UMP kinase [Chromatiales bacterium]|nr:UMP kinase [Chromatiales bacterium]
MEAEAQAIRPNLRIVLKLSGEILSNVDGYGIDRDALTRLADEINALHQANAEVALVIGGGNIIRGETFSASGAARTTADYMGMLVTVVNALALQDALESQGIDTRVMSAIKIDEVCEGYIRRRAVRHLEKRRIVIFAAGTGNPFFTTDTAASLRAVEIEADILCKATKVDGVYSDNPDLNPDAKLYKKLSYDEALSQNLAVMDTTAIVLCREHKIPIRVFNMKTRGACENIIKGSDIGTLISI